jgi:tetratricopeptide (TPR) repeat protein
VESLVGLAILARDASRFRAAERYLACALELAERLGVPYFIADVELHLGELHLVQERFADAVAWYERAAATDDSVRALLLPERDELGYFAGPVRHVPYERVVRAHVFLGQPRQALAWAERAKARAFLRQLGRAQLLASSRVPAELLERETEALRGLKQAGAVLDDAEGPAALVAWQRASAALDRALLAIEPHDPEHVALRRGRPVSWEELLACLGAGAAGP